MNNVSMIIHHPALFFSGYNLFWILWEEIWDWACWGEIWQRRVIHLSGSSCLRYGSSSLLYHWLNGSLFGGGRGIKSDSPFYCCVCFFLFEAPCDTYPFVLCVTFQVTSLLNRMQLRAERSTSSEGQCLVKVHVPPSRSDVLHPCDVMEVTFL